MEQVEDHAALVGHHFLEIFGTVVSLECVVLLEGVYF